MSRTGTTKRGRPATAEMCRRIKPQEPTDVKIVHCIRRSGHQKGPCSNGDWKWTERGVISRP